MITYLVDDTSEEQDVQDQSLENQVNVHQFDQVQIEKSISITVEDGSKDERISVDWVVGLVGARLQVQVAGDVGHQETDVDDEKQGVVVPEVTVSVGTEGHDIQLDKRKDHCQCKLFVLGSIVSRLEHGEDVADAQQPSCVHPESSESKEKLRKPKRLSIIKNDIS